VASDRLRLGLVKTLILPLSIFIGAGLTSSFASSNNLTRYDDPAFAEFCSLQLRYPNHFDAAVTVGTWGLCAFSDRIHTGPGAVAHNSALYERSGNRWVLSMKGNGYIDEAALEGAGVPIDVAHGLFEKFWHDVCLKADVPKTKHYGDRP
jgi:hypothetical protein